MWTPEIRWLDPRSLKPFENNAKLHPADQVQEIVDSIQERGFMQPIVVDKGMVIVVGHGRQMASLAMHLERVPVIVADHLSEEQLAAYRLADNKMAETGWDFPKLAVEFKRLKTLNIDLARTGFKAPEIKRIISRFEKSQDLQTDANDIPTTVEPRVKAGQLWAMGEHRLLCGDSTSPVDIDKLMGGAQADLIFTDPPWNVNYGADMDEFNAQGYRPRQIMNDHKEPEEWRKFTQAFCSALFRASKPGCPIYCVMSAQEWPIIDASLREAGFHWSSSIIWAKDRLVLSRKDYHTQYEPIWYGWNSDGPRLVPLADRTQSDVWNIPRPSRSDQHPTMKPVELVERAVMNSSNIGDIVLDLFGGSGSTLIACEKTKRKSFSMELDPHYADGILQRWANATGCQPTLISQDSAQLP